MRIIHLALTFFLFASITGCAISPPAWNGGGLRAEEFYLWDVSMQARFINDSDCEGYVASVRETVSDEFMVEDIYSCPDASKTLQGTCHVSALVTTPQKVQYVLDNGAVELFGGFGIASKFRAAMGDRPTFVGESALIQLAGYVAAEQRKSGIKRGTQDPLSLMFASEYSE